MRATGPSPWTSEEGREFLQGRTGDFARTMFWVAASLAVLSVIISRAFPVRGAATGAFSEAQVLNVVIALVFLIEWTLLRRAPLPLEVVLVADSGGTFLVAALDSAMPLHMPIEIRPELVSLIGLMGILLYRAAVVPGDATRAFWIGLVSAAPLPVVTYVIYSKAAPGSTVSSPAGYAAWVFVWCTFAVLLSSATARVIYGLRRKISEARRLGQYTLEQKIGEGGMGTVYRASHAMLRRPTAIKLLAPERSGEIDLARFEREVQMTSQLASPHTVSVYDYGRTPDGIFYYAMEYLDGITLEELVRRDGPMPPARVVHVLAQVCRALEEAHGVGLIHRDIKPANILLCERGGTPDLAKVVDFGLVKNVMASGASGVTLENVALGTPHYMPPEAIASPDRMDARGDLYAVGAVAYFLLTGKVVFEGDTAMDVFAHHLRSVPVAPSARLGRPIPAGLESVVLAALAKDPDQRPESARALREALLTCVDVPAWKEADAAAWWHERGRRLKRAPGDPESLDPKVRTVVVDRAAG
ncbi:MAG TPA: serine/threonine-protein kinase [Thermoanaerobaculia bacterium]|nr:serine/threonine-protein kinase [Thermoanaerobaculia bacterium]